jgi:hypothetical protein
VGQAGMVRLMRYGWPDTEEIASLNAVKKYFIFP